MSAILPYRDAILIGALTSLVSYALLQSTAPQWNMFRYQQIDASAPTDPWGKSAGDLNGDGAVDLLVGGHASRTLVAYMGPDWTRRVVAEGYAFSTDHEVADIDSDGRNDIVSVTDEALVWFRGPDWEPTEIDRKEFHDVEVADLDGDGDMDIVARDQGAFGGSGRTLSVYEQMAPGTWRHTTREIPEGEGLTVADLDGDSYPDVVVNQVWLRNQGVADAERWVAVVYTRSWDWPHAALAVGDMDGDGRDDIVAAPAETEGETYRISWFRSPSDPTGIWPETVVDGSVEAVHHFVSAADMNMDGRTDIATAEMHQGADPDEVSVYVNEGGGKAWHSRLLSTKGSHGTRVVDADADGDPDLFGANWSGPNQSVDMWENLHCPEDPKDWSRVVVDANQVWTSLFVSSADIDGDGLDDVVSGAWWYENSGMAAGRWERKAFSEQPFNAAMTFDVDGDDDIDVLGTRARGTEPSGDVVLALNDGTGAFDVLDLAALEGDFLQGVGRIDDSDETAVVLSWHASGTPLHLLELPGEGTSPRVRRVLEAGEAQNEAVSVGDLDGDSDEDLVLGTKWLENVGDGFRQRTLHDTPDPPDRNVIADIDGDGRSDVVIGYEAVDRPGRVAWYRNDGDPSREWRETFIVELTGPMSLDAGDVDLDGDTDIVVGEHNLSRPHRARLLFIENVDGAGTSWRKHLIYRGDEHHDGAQLADVDGDGDLDVLSIGWSHNRVLLYENRMSRCSAKIESGGDQ